MNNNTTVNDNKKEKHNKLQEVHGLPLQTRRPTKL